MRLLMSGALALLVASLCWLVLAEATTMRRSDRLPVERMAEGWR